MGTVVIFCFLAFVALLIYFVIGLCVTSFFIDKLRKDCKRINGEEELSHEYALVFIFSWPVILLTYTVRSFVEFFKNISYNMYRFYIVLKTLFMIMIGK